MAPTFPEESKSTHKSWQIWLALTILVVAFIYLWILPLFRPRGDFLGGYYSLKDIYIGIPVGLAVICSLIILAVPRRFKRPFALRLASICISTLFTLFLCDLAYALVVNQVWRANFWLDQGHIARKYSTVDPELGFIRKPFVTWRGYAPGVNKIVDYQTDENGFRNSVGTKQADVVFIGDSFTEASQVEERDTFVRRVEAISGLITVNLGRGAYGPQQELIVLKRYGLTYRPRAVIWQLFEGNDLNDARVFAEWKKNPDVGFTSFKERYTENSLLADWIPRIRREPNLPTVRFKHNNGTETPITLRYDFDPDAPSKNAAGFAETTQAIETGYRLCQTQGIKLVVVLVPTMVRVMEPYLLFDREEDKTRYLPKASTDVKDFSSKLADFCGEIGCSFIDTFSVLRKAAAVDNRNLYVPVDEHLDTAGHEVVAQAVVEELRSAGVVSPNEPTPE